MVELVDTLDLGSSASQRGGSSPSRRTINKVQSPVTSGKIIEQVVPRSKLLERV